MELLLFWLIFAAIVGVIASNRGRSGFGWFLLSVLLSPILMLILVLVLSDKRKAQTATAESKDRRPCPRCGEQIIYSASVCRFCGAEVDPMSQLPVAEKGLCRKCGKPSGGWYRLTCQNCGTLT